LALRKVENGVRFSVADTGVGIPKEKIEKIFDKFYQVQNQMRHSEEGLGLGLALCNGIVSAHGSRIFVESEVGK
jgi:signal transduction histidine kinase